MYLNALYYQHFFMDKSPSIYKNVLAFAPTYKYLAILHRLVRLGMLVRRDST